MDLRTGWSIIGRHGLYTGWHHTRREMIAQHVGEIEGVSSITFGGRLTEDQLAGWRECQKKGDRAIKIKIATI